MHITKLTSSIVFIALAAMLIIPSVAHATILTQPSNRTFDADISS